MEWKGKILSTMAEVGQAVVECSSRDEAQEFMRLFEASTFTKEDLGYWTGYFDHETQDRVWEWFDIEHPMFCGRRHPSDTELRLRGIVTGMALRWPEAKVDFGFLEKLFVRLITDTHAQLQSKNLLLQQLLHSCYLITRCLGGKDGYLPQLGEPKTREFVDMVLFVRKLLGDKEPMFYEPSPQGGSEDD